MVSHLVMVHRKVLAALIVATVALLMLMAAPAQAQAGDFLLDVNRQQNVVTVYAKDGNGEYTVPIKAMRCATGRNYSSPAGWSVITDKYEWHMLNGGVWGQYACRYNGSCLFHSVYYYDAYNKGSISESRYNKLGTQASDGCINLTVRDAKWIYDNCPSGTTVHVYDSDNPGPLGKPETVLLNADRNWGWDPTDPDPDNYYYRNLQSISIRNSEQAIAPNGGTLALEVQYKTTGSVPELGKRIEWATSDASVATVDDNGVVTGHNSGSAVITASNLSGTISATCTVNVDYYVDTIELDDMNLVKGQTITIAPRVTPAGAASQQFIWSSSNTKVATISDAGEVKAIGPGTTTITVSSQPALTSNGQSKSATATFTVTQPKVTYIGDGGKVLKTQDITYGDKLAYPTVKDTSAQIFVGWDKSYDPETMQLTCTAKFEAQAEEDPAEVEDSDSDDESTNAGEKDGADNSGETSQSVTVATTETSNGTSAEEEGSDGKSADAAKAVGESDEVVTATEGDAEDVEEPATVLRELDASSYAFAGCNRYATNMASTTQVFQRADHVIVSCGASPYDALASSGLASFDNAPVLLTDTDSLSWETYWTCSVLDATQATITGGTAAVSDKAAGQLQKVLDQNCDKGQTASVERLGGADRVATADKIFASRLGKWGGTAIIASSQTFADAASAAPFAAAQKAPIFLANQDGVLSDATLAQIGKGGFTKVVIAGGTSAVSDQVERQLGSSGAEIVRMDGSTRYVTSLKLAVWSAKNSDGLSWDTVAFATGQNFPDGISGATTVGDAGGLMLLIDDVKGGTYCMSTIQKADPQHVMIFGGNAAVPQSIRDQILQ